MAPGLARMRAALRWVPQLLMYGEFTWREANSPGERRGCEKHCGGCLDERGLHRVWSTSGAAGGERRRRLAHARVQGLAIVVRGVRR